MTQIEMNSQEAIELRMLNQMVGSIVRRDLNLLKTIDRTIDALREEKAKMDLHERMIAGQIERIKKINRVIDEDGSLISMLEETRDIFAAFHAKLKMKCDSARNAPELKPEDGVVEAYCDIIESAASLHNTINDLCWVIGEHDADFDKVVPGGPYKTPEELFAALGV
jgi:hypothetical protein